MPVLISPSTKGVDFICGFEQYREFLYKDGGGVWTIGYGEVIPSDQLAKYANGVTVQWAKDAVYKHLDVLSSELGQLALNGLAQNQYDAIYSLVYNIGIGAFTSSTIYKQIMTRHVDLSPWLLFIHDAKGIVEQGLVKRRLCELKLFIYGIYAVA